MYNQAELRNIIDKALVSFPFDSESERLISPVKYIISIGGKRVRPVIALMSCNLYLDKIDHAVIPVTGLEIFHNFTLVHDDIIDQALVRRSFPSVHAKWNINQAILSGDVMAFIAYQCLLHSPPYVLTEVLRVFNKAAIDVCTGQQLDMDFENIPVVTTDEYLRMIGLKTAALLAASTGIGAILGRADKRDCDLLTSYGTNLGLAFQIQDDLLDVFGDVKVFGKKTGGDIIANKKTFLYVKSMEIANVTQKEKLKLLFATNGIHPEDKVKAVIEIYNKLDIKEIAGKIIDEYFTAAISSLDKIKTSEERKEVLVNFTHSLIRRDS